MRNDRCTERNKVYGVDTIRLEMSEGVRTLATPAKPGESVKSCIRRVSQKAGLGFGDVRRLWYQTWQRVPADIADKVRKAVEDHERRNAAELATFRARYEALAHHSGDQDFYRIRAAEAYRPAVGSSGTAGVEEVT